jgi:DNA-binding XRE family transcriptional regulator
LLENLFCCIFAYYLEMGATFKILQEKMIKPHRERIAKRIISLRTASNLSQEQLANATELSVNTIIGIEEAKFSVNIDVLEKIASALGTRVDLV